MVVSSITYGKIEKPDLMKIVTTPINLKTNHVHSYKSPFPSLSTDHFIKMFFNNNENVIDIVLFNLFHRIYSSKAIKPFQPIQSIFISCQV